MNATTVDIFCRVVDNYGDIGVTWRLARQLVAEHGLDVRLFVDDVASFDKISSGCNAHGGKLSSKDNDQSEFPNIFHWKRPPNGEFNNFDYTADIVIEAFACELPESYLVAMSSKMLSPMLSPVLPTTPARPKKTLWINLEYLSAESWAAAHHLLASPHPRLSMTKYFYFPGFDATSGGLIRENTIRLALVIDSSAPSTLSIFAFGYATPALAALIQTFALAANVSHITVPEGALAQALAEHEKIRIVPFVPQPDFDALLATHDFLIVRGEDSFVRAQYAAKPFIWQIYPQDEGAHLVKLNAFLDLYCVGMSLPLANSLREISRCLSGAALPNIPRQTPLQCWQNLATHFAEWCAHAAMWQRQLLTQPDLASQLMTFYQKTLIIQGSVAPSQASFNRS